MRQIYCFGGYMMGIYMFPPWFNCFVGGIYWIEYISPKWDLLSLIFYSLRTNLWDIMINVLNFPQYTWVASASGILHKDGRYIPICWVHETFRLKADYSMYTVLDDALACLREGSDFYWKVGIRVFYIIENSSEFPII